MIAIRLTNSWVRVERMVGRLPAAVLRAERQALQQEAQFFRTKLVEGIKDQAPGGKAFKPLSPLTIAIRYFSRLRSTKALIERGDLLRSIRVHKLDEDKYFIGIHRTARNRFGKSLVDIGKMHEFGAGPFVIRLTPKMRAFLHMAFRKMRLPESHGGHGSGQMVLRIPARPVFGPVLEKYGKRADVEKRMNDRFIMMMESAFKAG